MLLLISIHVTCIYFFHLSNTGHTSNTGHASNTGHTSHTGHAGHSSSNLPLAVGSVPLTVDNGSPLNNPCPPRRSTESMMARPIIKVSLISGCGHILPWLLL